MAKIFYSMSGEGRGHSTRVRAIVDQLRDHHQIELIAPGDAYDLLAPAYKGTEIRVRRIPCLRFYYTKDHRLDTLKTAIHGAKYLRRLPSLVRKLEKLLRREKPDLVITDFEPALPRAARRCGIPFISLNHQHFLIVNDLSELPGYLRRQTFLMSLVVRGYYRGMARTIVSSFYDPPVKPKYRDIVVPVGSILRPAVVNARRKNGNHVVAYLRKFAPENVLEALRGCGREVRVYGVGERPADGNLSFHAISEDDFLRDLSTGAALICTAGNQLLGEALYLGKPVLTFPEPNNYEQYINAWFLHNEGAGEWVEMDKLNVRHIRRFLNNLDGYRARIEPEHYNGTPLALKTIEEFLSQCCRSREIP